MPKFSSCDTRGSNRSRHNDAHGNAEGPFCASGGHSNNGAIQARYQYTVACR